MNSLKILKREDLNVHFGEDFLPINDDNEINELKIEEDLLLTDKEIESTLIASNLSIEEIAKDEDTLFRLKPIALDIISYRLCNRSGEDSELFSLRYKQALASLNMISKGLASVIEKEGTNNKGIKSVKLRR